MTARCFIVVMGLSACLCTGCVSPLPRYEWVSLDHAMATMNERANKIQTISASGRLSFRRADGADAQLDCAMVYRKPDQFRFRAWKFSRAILDFTMKGDDVWIVAPKRKDQGKRKRGKPEIPDSLSADHIATSWSLVVSGFSPKLWAPCKSSRSDTFALCGKSGTKTARIVCEMDRNTLTTQSCSACNDKGDELFNLSLRRYRRFGDLVFPTRIRASSGGNAFTWLLDDIDINESLAPRAFVPPRRAVKQP